MQYYRQFVNSLNLLTSYLVLYFHHMTSSRYFLKTMIEEIDFDFESFSPCNAATRLDADLLPTNEAPKKPIMLPITISINRTPAKKEKS